MFSPFRLFNPILLQQEMKNLDFMSVFLQAVFVNLHTSLDNVKYTEPSTVVSTSS